MLKFKNYPGREIYIKGIQPEMVLAAIVVRDVFEQAGYDCTITGALDGQHMHGSLHYKGYAVDVRTRDVPTEIRGPLAEKLAHSLGPDFDVVVHSTHYHIEFDPKQDRTGSPA